MTINVNGVDCVLGVDLSTYQPSVNWQVLAQCRQWVAIKASGGDSPNPYQDGMFVSHRNNSNGVMPRSAYHFLGAGNGAAQADFFVRVTNGYTGFQLPPTVDFEQYGNRGQFHPSGNDLRAFLAELALQIGEPWTGPTGESVGAWIYSGSSMVGNFYAELAKYDLWLAAYLNKLYPNPNPGLTNGCTPNVSALGNPNRYVPWPWSQWSAYQFAGGDGGVAGVGNGVSNCDQDVMTVEVFNRLTHGTGGGGLSAQEVAEINANTNAGFAAMQAQLGTWMQEQSANVVAALTKTITANSYNSRRFAFRIGAAPDAWLVSFDAQGATRTHIPDQATEQALVDIGAISPVLNIDVTDEAKAAALLAIREVPWRPLGT